MYGCVVQLQKIQRKVVVFIMTEWEKLTKQYPNQWAFISNVRRNDDGEIIDFNLLKGCPKSEKSKWLEYYMQGTEKFECIRTTFNAPNVGYLSL